MTSRAVASLRPGYLNDSRKQATATASNITLYTTSPLDSLDPSTPRDSGASAVPACHRSNAMKKGGEKEHKKKKKKNMPL